MAEFSATIKTSTNLEQQGVYNVLDEQALQRLLTSDFRVGRGPSIYGFRRLECFTTSLPPTVADLPQQTQQTIAILQRSGITVSAFRDLQVSERENDSIFLPCIGPETASRIPSAVVWNENVYLPSSYPYLLESVLIPERMQKWRSLQSKSALVNMDTSTRNEISAQCHQAHYAAMLLGILCSKAPVEIMYEIALLQQKQIHRDIAIAVVSPSYELENGKKVIQVALPPTHFYQNLYERNSVHEAERKRQIQDHKEYQKKLKSFVEHAKQVPDAEVEVKTFSCDHNYESDSFRTVLIRCVEGDLSSLLETAYQMGVLLQHKKR